MIAVMRAGRAGKSKMWRLSCRLDGGVDSCCGGGLVVGKLEGLIKTRDPEDALSYDRDVTEDKSASSLGQQVVQYQEIAEA